MASQFSVNNAFSAFTLKNQFKAITGATVYIGNQDEDPLNPLQQQTVSIRNEAGDFVPVPQPISINSGGFMTYNGQNYEFFTAKPFSIVILNTLGAELWRMSSVATLSGYDWEGFTAELLAQAGITDDGQPDELGNSKRVAAIKKINDGVYSRTFSSVDEMTVFTEHKVGNVVKTLSKNGSDSVEYWEISSLPFDWRVASIALTGGLKAVKICPALTSPRNQNLEIVAHRALQFVFMEGTMHGYSSCDADWLEVDVQITSDGVPVLYHDDDLSSKTTGAGAISGNTLAQVQSAKFLDAVGTKYENLLKIPTFDEFCKWAAENGRKFWWESKNYRTQSDIQLMLDVVKKYNLQDRSVLNSFIFGDLIFAQNLSNDIQLAYTMGSIDPTFEPRIHQMASEWSNKPWILVTHTYLVSNPHVVGIARGLGVDVAAWTPNKLQEIRAVRGIGVNTVVTDITVNSIRGGWYA